MRFWHVLPEDPICFLQDMLLIPCLQAGHVFARIADDSQERGEIHAAQLLVHRALRCATGELAELLETTSILCLQSSVDCSHQVLPLETNYFAGVAQIRSSAK